MFPRKKCGTDTVLQYQVSFSKCHFQSCFVHKLAQNKTGKNTLKHSLGMLHTIHLNTFESSLIKSFMSRLLSLEEKHFVFFS